MDGCGCMPMHMAGGMYTSTVCWCFRLEMNKEMAVAVPSIVWQS